jgi:hypothetical protein
MASNYRRRHKKYHILGLIFDPESEREVEGFECEVNTPSK